MEEEYSNIDKKFVYKRFSKEIGLFSFYIIAYIFLTPIFSTTYMSSYEFGEYSLAYKIVYMYFTALILRCKYYTGWKLSHTTMSLSGITFGRAINKETGKEEMSLEKAKTFDFYGVEIEPNPKKKITVSKTRN